MLFIYDAHLEARSMDVMRILRNACGLGKSKWSLKHADAVGGASGSTTAVAKRGATGGGGSDKAVVKSVGKTPAAGGKGGGRFAAVGKGAGNVDVTPERDVVELVNPGNSGALSVLRSWIDKNKLIFNAVGSRAWTEHEPVVGGS